MEEVERLREEVAGLRRWIRGLALVSAALAAGLLWVSREPETLRVRELVVVDEAGTTRARLGVGGLDDARLELADPAGSPRMTLRAAAGHTTLELLDAGRRTRVRLSEVEDLTSLHLAHGARTAQLQVAPAGASLSLVDLEDALAATVRASREGTEVALSRTVEDEPRWTAALTAGVVDGMDPALVLVDGDAYVQASLEDAPRLVLGDGDREQAVTLP